MVADRYVWNALGNKLSFILNILNYHFLLFFPFLVPFFRVPQLQNHFLPYLTLSGIHSGFSAHEY